MSEERVEIFIEDRNGKILAEASGEKDAVLVYKEPYQNGDRISVRVSEKNAFYWLQPDEAVGRSLVYISGDFTRKIPFEEEKRNLPLNAFAGTRHLIFVRKAEPYEYSGYRNLALNVSDEEGLTQVFPHASDNIGNGRDTAFRPCNAIDGTIVTERHGKWPFGSWGTSQREDAVWKLDFGREVEADRIVLYLRADFPHDSWWEKGTVTFSDGTKMELSLNKTGQAQEFTFNKKKIRWLYLSDLKKAQDESAFPGLTQMEVYGKDII